MLSKTHSQITAKAAAGPKSARRLCRFTPRHNANVAVKDISGQLNRCPNIIPRGGAAREPIALAIGQQKRFRAAQTQPNMVTRGGAARQPDRTRDRTTKTLPGCTNAAQHGDAGWSSPVARQAHNLKVAGSNPAPATSEITNKPIESQRSPVALLQHIAAECRAANSLCDTRLTTRYPSPTNSRPARPWERMRQRSRRAGMNGFARLSATRWCSRPLILRP